MSSEFLNYTQTNSETSAISAEPSADPAHFKADALVVFLESDGLRGPLIEIDKSTGGLLQQLFQQGELTGKRYECIPLYAPNGLA